MFLLVAIALGVVAFAMHNATGAQDVQRAHAPHAAAPSGDDPVIQAAQIALGSELYPSRLRAFAATLQPDYAPFAGGLLGKAAAIDAGVLPGHRGA